MITILVLICSHLFHRMYQCKLAQLKKQLHQLKDGTLPEYQKKLKKIEYTKKDRLRINDIWYNYMVSILPVLLLSLLYYKYIIYYKIRHEAWAAYSQNTMKLLKDNTE